VSQPSPPTARVVRILEYLAGRPGSPQTVTQIARALRMARATCALVVEQLADHAWVVRTDDGYVLGPAVVPVARAALDSPASGSVAHEALAELAADLDTLCTTSAVIGGDIVVLDRAGPPPLGDGEAVAVGARFPFTPPSGIMHVAWEPDAVVDAWLQRTPSPVPASDIARLRDVARDVRVRGVLVERLTDQAPRLLALLAGMANDEMPDALRRLVGDMVAPLASRDYLARELRPGRSYPVHIVAAPTFDPTGRQRHLVAAFVAQPALPYAELTATSQRVRAAADQVTAAMGGADPWRATSKTSRPPRG
jgi:DNA-binding IclR family transcriptional regulator